MKPFYRSGLLALTLMSGLVSSVVWAETDRLKFESWFTDAYNERLVDSSILSEYYAETISLENNDVFFRIGFVPRFDCAPMFSLLLAYPSDKRDIVDYKAITAAIDGTPLKFPVLLDQNEDHLAVYLNTDLQRRMLARIKVDIGNILMVRSATAELNTFSLLGSREAVDNAEKACRRHSPEAVN